MDAKGNDTWKNGTMRCISCSEVESPIIALAIKCGSGDASLPESLFIEYSGGQIHNANAIQFSLCRKHFDVSAGNYSSNCKATTLSYGRPSVTQCVFPFEDRLCAKCSCPLDCVHNCSCAFETSSGCEECVDFAYKPQFWIAIILVVCSIVLFVFVPKKHSILIWAELIVFLVYVSCLVFFDYLNQHRFIVATGSDSWIASFMLLVAVVQALSQIKHEPHQDNDERSIVSASGFAKLFVFFVQTSTTVNDVIWTSLGEWRERLDVFHLSAIGLQCDLRFRAFFSVGLLFSRFK
jgi:hypothetical protein